jgi:large subunit ribosomal protein L17
MSGYSRLARNSAARKALLRDLITDLILNGSIKTTVTKANELKRLADKMVTLGKKNTLASRRQAAKLVRSETDANGVYALNKLFDEIAPRFASRNGGYTRVLKSGFRYGDCAPMAIIELVDRDVNAKGAKDIERVKAERAALEAASANEETAA